MRLDRLLYCLRLARSRTGAQRWIGEGHMRINGARVTRQDQPIAVGDVLTLPLARKVLAVEILALPERRGPAKEAQACYRPLDAGGPMRIAGHTRGAPASRPDNEGSAQQ
jgi:ribosome-associated heat shock protein Hsp15